MVPSGLKAALLASASRHCVVAALPRLSVRTVASNYGNMLRKDFRAVADAVRELADTQRPRGRLSR
ncbi:hypothetical protein ACTWPT_54270 [Nonomuraea sp. 3N208]|uniref:hypothetical protein n=1 Tax=Nonomuraea sp. 3N208 TaxID=3457421 RepID=UPI003FD097F4